MERDDDFMTEWGPFNILARNLRCGIISRRKFLEMWAQEQKRQMCLHDRYAECFGDLRDRAGKGF